MHSRARAPEGKTPMAAHSYSEAPLERGLWRWTSCKAQSERVTGPAFFPQ